MEKAKHITRLVRLQTADRNAFAETYGAAGTSGALSMVRIAEAFDWVSCVPDSDEDRFIRAAYRLGYMLKVCGVDPAEYLGMLTARMETLFEHKAGVAADCMEMELECAKFAMPTLGHMAQPHLDFFLRLTSARYAGLFPGKPLLSAPPPEDATKNTVHGVITASGGVKGPDAGSEQVEVNIRAALLTAKITSVVFAFAILLYVFLA